jgi:hypothetical protein
VELRGGKAAPRAAAKKKSEAPKKKQQEEPPPKASDESISVDLDNHGVQSQALIRFDDIIGNGPGRIPPGSKVTSAVLTLHGNDDGGGKIHVHRVLADWDPSSIT